MAEPTIVASEGIQVTRRRRVVHVINSLFAGGAETMLGRIVGAADADGRFEHVVLPLMPGGAVEQRIRDAGALVDPLEVDGPANLLTAPFRLAARLSRLHPDIVQGWLLQGNLAATVGAGLARVRAPVLWNVRWTLYDVESEPLRTRSLLRASGLLARFPARIVYNSRLAVGQHAAIGFPTRLARVIPNGFDLEQLRPDAAARSSVRHELGIAPDVKVVGMLARYHPMKDHATSLRAAAHLLERGVNAIFVYAGHNVDNATPDLVELVKDLGLGDRVRLLGERRDVARLYSSFDLYWMSSLTSGIAEGFPNVVAEAMACGVPCVTTDSGDAAWIIGRTGRIVPSRDPLALADAAAELLLADPAEIARMGHEARARIERDFSLESVVAGYEALYAEVLGI